MNDYKWWIITDWKLNVNRLNRIEVDWRRTYRRYRPYQWVCVVPSRALSPVRNRTVTTIRTKSIALPPRLQFLETFLVNDHRFIFFLFSFFFFFFICLTIHVFLPSFLPSLLFIINYLWWRSLLADWLIAIFHLFCRRESLRTTTRRSDCVSFAGM